MVPAQTPQVKFMLYIYFFLLKIRFIDFFSNYKIHVQCREKDLLKTHKETKNKTLSPKITPINLLVHAFWYISVTSMSIGMDIDINITAMFKSDHPKHSHQI